MKWVNRLLLIWLFPVITATWMLGWTLYWFGSKQQIPRLAFAGDRCLNRLLQKEGAAGGKAC